jgi:hypothetical protein
MLSVEDLGREIAELAARMDAATHRLLECIRQFDESNEWHAQGAVSCAHWLSWRIGLDLATAREKVRVARALGLLPAIDQALHVGRLSYAKVRALTRVATPENEARLLDMAIFATGAQLERICRGYRGALACDRTPDPEERSVRRRVLPGGMVKVEMVLGPDEADLVMRAIDCAREMGQPNTKRETATVAATDTRERGNEHVSAEDSEQVAAWPSRPDGVVALAESFLAGNAAKGNGGERYQVVVHVDQDALAPDGTSDGTWAATLEDGTHVSAESLRRVACDCGVVAAVGDQDGGLSIGRRSRSIPPAIRRAIQLRDRGCRFPGCTHDRFLHGHHVRHWLHGGETSVENLIQLCTRHHHLVHEGGWSVVRDDAGNWTFADPKGKTLAGEAPQAWSGNILTWLQEWADEHGLDIGSDTNEPLWDGTRPDYDMAVGALLAG